MLSGEQVVCLAAVTPSALLKRLYDPVSLQEAAYPAVMSEAVQGLKMSKNVHIWPTHDLLHDRDVTIVGETFLHRWCERCRRDFVIPPGGTSWIAVHVGMFDFKFLDQQINNRWLLE